VEVIYYVGCPDKHPVSAAGPFGGSRGLEFGKKRSNSKFLVWASSHLEFGKKRSNSKFLVWASSHLCPGKAPEH